MAKDPAEWLNQADYDLETAKILLEKERNFYAVFMAHLSLEKALKGWFWKKLDTIPPKTHDLTYLIKKIGTKPTDELFKFIVRLNEAHITTRYPEEIKTIQKKFPKAKVEEILLKCQEVIKWIKTQF
jgi:HEPN domain-containing protein